MSQWNVGWVVIVLIALHMASNVGERKKRNAGAITGPPAESDRDTFVLASQAQSMSRIRSGRSAGCLVSLSSFSRLQHRRVPNMLK